MPKLFLISLGCAKNLVDAETMLGETLGDDFELVLDPAAADVAVVNTCGFIEEARREAREVLEEMLAVKSRAKHDLKVVAAGCWSERDPDALLAEFPGLDAVWGLSIPSSLAASIRELYRGRGAAGLGVPPGPREGARLVSTLPSHAYLRISDGCDNRCRYCAIPLIRGGLRSRRPEAVVEEARQLADQGARELVVISQDTTAYGHDLETPGTDLPALLEKLLAAVSVPRIRLLYAHPAHLDDRVISLVRDEPRLCGYLDLPIQHIADPVLERMGRGYGRERVLDILDRLGSRVTLRTTLLVGFPGETEQDFREAMDLVAAGRFRQLGVFAYSPEKGTPAFDFDNPVPPEAARERRDALMAAQSRIAFAWLDSRVGGKEKVLVDSRLEGGWLSGRSVHEAPDADGCVLLRSARAAPGDIIETCIVSREGYDLVGEHAAPGGNRRRRKR